MKILVTGAAGYIGSVVTEKLIENGEEVIALDNLQNGHRNAVHRGALFVQGDLLEDNWLKTFLVKSKVDAVIHLAAEALIEESIRDPGKFFRANVIAGHNLLEAMVKSGTKRIVNSSTAAVYGEPNEIPLNEDSALAPINAYGESKLVFEQMLKWYHIDYELNFISFRYFNVCGATVYYGEDHIPETHIIPILLNVALGKQDVFYLNGTDYDTPDCTCIRDYVHVVDIARAHILALKVIDQVCSHVYNIGTGTGYSNLQVIKAIERISGKDIDVINIGKRPGDPSRLIASSEMIQKDLGFDLKYPSLEIMIESAWLWKKEHPNGYR